MRNILLAAALAATFACGAEPSVEQPTAAAIEEVGDVAGRVCNTHVPEWVVGDVYVPIGDADVFQTRTAADGSFVLEDVPAGERVVYVLGRGYEQAFIVQVEAGETVEIGGGDC